MRLDFFTGRFNLKDGLELGREKAIDGLEQKRGIPTIHLDRFLKQLVQKRTVQHGRVGFAGSLDSILEDSSSETSKRVCHHGSRDEVVRVKDEHVVMVVDDALAGRGEASYDMDEGTCGAGSVIPRFPENDGFEQLCLLVLHE